ncbi:MAG: hypothetical protein AB8H79_19540 [Myxococcota bacterium]
MSLPPPALLPFLARHPTERFIGASLTADVHRFAPKAFDGPRPEAPIWLAATDARLWACAWDERTERAWGIAVGRPDLVVMSAGWQRDELTLAGWRVRLRRGSRREVAELIELWMKANPNGDPWPEQMPLPIGGVPLAHGAEPMAQALIHLPGERGERWLAAIETDATWPIHTESGPSEVPVVLACSDRRNVLVAAVAEGYPTPVFAVPAQPIDVDSKGWVVAGRPLKPRGNKAQAELMLTMVPISDPAERWSLAVRHALITGSTKRTLKLINEADRLGKARRAWPALVQIALALDQGPIAAAAAWRAVQDDPDLNVPAVVKLTQREGPAVKKAIKAERLAWTGVRRLASTALDGLAQMPTVSDLLPWPPVSAAQCWATALSVHDRWQLASRLFATLPAGADRDLALATCASVVNRPAAAERWRAAALSARALGRSPYRLLAQATELDEQGRDRWLWGLWCWQDGQLNEARAQWRRALALHEDGAFTHTLEIEALRALAEVALTADRPELADQALHRASDANPGALHLHTERAQLVATACARPIDAADILIEAADLMDQGIVSDTDIPRWTLWVQAAQLRRDAGRPDAARSALREALAGDFLDLEAWQAALDCDVGLPDSLVGWWKHVYAILAGGDAAPGAPLGGLSSMDDATLDVLHPGGAGWLEGLRHQLDGAQPPSYEALTRGLDRLREAEFNSTAEVLETLADRLTLPVTPTGHVFRGTGAWGVSAWPSTPPVVLVGADHLRDGERHLPANILTFAVAAELVHLRCNHPVLTFDASWLGTSRSVYDQVNGWAGTAETIFDIVTLVPGLDQAKKIQTVVKLASTAFRTRGALDKAVRLSDPVTQWLGLGGNPETKGLSREGLSGAALQFRVQAERAALLMTGDLAAAVHATLALSTRSAHLLQTVQKNGLLSVLADPNSGLSGDELFRLTSLVEFAATRMPWGR